MRIKLYEQYNREETLLGLAKMGLRTNRKEVFDLAVKRGLDVEKYLDKLEVYCMNVILNYISLEWIMDKDLYQELIDKTDSLDVNHQTSVQNLEGLAPLINVTELSITNSNLKSIKGIEHLSNITYLEIYNNELSDLDGVQHLDKLYDLDLDNNNVESLEPLKNLNNLNNLSCSNNRISDLTPLSNIEDLGQLDIRSNRITSIKPILKLPLHELQMLGNPLPDEILEFIDFADVDVDFDGILLYYQYND